ncbi:hypothetical protein [Cupriavidus basilensis]
MSTEQRAAMPVAWQYRAPSDDRWHDCNDPRAAVKAGWFVRPLYDHPAPAAAAMLDGGYVYVTKELLADYIAMKQREDTHDSTAAARDVLAERSRQVEAEGWTPEHDDEHADGGLAKAAATYAMHGSGTNADWLLSYWWPWDAEWWKPTDQRRSLVKAGALILAEIERLDRAAITKGEPQ